MNKLLKSKTFKIGLASGIVGIGIFGLTVGLSSTAKYNSENPRKKANDFAAKVSNLAFSLDAFDPNSDYKTVKNALLDNNNQIKNPDEVLKSFSFFQKNGEDLEKINFEDTEFTSAKIKYHILEIVPDDANQNFKVKFQASQKLANGDVAKSDIYEQTVAFAKQANLLIAEFNFSLKKITDKLNEKIQNLLSTKISNFADEGQSSQKTTTSKSATLPTSSNQKDVSTLRAVHFQQDLNQSLSPKDFGTKLASYFPTLNNLVESLNNSEENKIPNQTGRIFDFNFIRDRSTNQYVSVQNQVPSFFLEADLTTDARETLGSNVDFKRIINAVKLEKKDKTSYFLDLNDFISNLTLKNPVASDFADTTSSKFASEFLADVKSGFFSDQSERSKNTKSEIDKLLKSSKLGFSYGKLEEKFKNHKTSSLSYSFDTFKATIDKNDKTKVLIPYTIAINDGFFLQGGSSSSQIATKPGVLELSGFKNLDQKELPKQNKDLFSRRYLEKLGQSQDDVKKKQAVFAAGGQIRTSSRPLAKEEFEELFKDSDKNRTEIRKALASNYDFDFGPYFSLLDSWTGKTRFPKLEDIKKLSRDEAKSTADKNVSAINSRDFFRDGHQVASFFQDLLTKDQKTILETLFELSKKWGIVDEKVTLPKSLLESKGNMFAEADKVELKPKATPATTQPTAVAAPVAAAPAQTSTEAEIKKLSFNDLWQDLSGFGFYGTLILPDEIKKTLTSKKTDVEVFDELKKHKIPQFDNPTKPNDDKKLTEGTKFEKFGDVLKAFFLKAAQFDNFKSWTKLDENLKYSLEFTKETEEEKSSVEEKIKKAETDASPKSEGTPNQGKKAEGAQNQGKKAEGAQNQGKKAEGAQNQGTQNQGKILPVKFSFKISYGEDNQEKNFKTPEVKLFLQLDSDDSYNKRKDIKELDNAILSIPREYGETTLEAGKFESLKLENTTQPSSSSSKKVKVSEYLDELGKKIEEHLKEKKYETKVESIEESTDKNTKTLFFRLKKSDSASSQGSGGGTGGSVSSDEKISTLKFKVTVKKGQNAARNTNTQDQQANRGNQGAASSQASQPGAAK
ncbi:Uncharacterised protein [Mesomycoplasma dispar]|uniref:Adhesin n=1 Tax=Mesomycoplasma dispar TaxID=86660 RepID=A0AAJ5TCV3_9BACT|nr:hypothetical protein [Mesomycoplasma dispar]AJR12381.1 p97 cilium adhesin [Mesomycoplasma dispar]VEU62274.1 Uncharacterised protein [Mesomycoplasma dispar]